MIQNLLQKAVFGISSIQNIDPAGVQRIGQDIFLIAVALCYRSLDRDTLEDFKVDMVLDGFMLIVDPQGLGNLG